MYNIIGKKEKTVKNLGGKGFNLLKLDEFKLTPNFVIISNSIFNEYLKKDSRLYDYLKNNLPGKINLRFVKRRILQFKFDEKLLIKINSALGRLNINEPIIRSSFISEDSKNLSYAGLFSSYRCKRKVDIFLYIKKVWASQFTERVFNYQKEKKNFRYGMAVIIQDFIQPDFSGVVFLQQSRPQEIFVEYCEKSYQAVESGTKNPFIYLLRNGYPYLRSLMSESHDEWIQNLIGKVSFLGKRENTSLDIEFATFKDRLYLLQMRPLTKRIETRNMFYIFECYQRWKYHLNDFQAGKFKKILKELNINIPLKIEKKEEGIFIGGDSYFLFIDKLKDRSVDLKFLNKFFKYFLRFISFQLFKIKRASKESVPLISAVKELNFKMSIIDFIHNLLIEDLKEFLIKKYNITENKNFRYFIPPLSFTTQIFLLHLNCKSNRDIPDSYDKDILKRLDERDLNRLIKNIKINQREVLKILKKLKGEQKKYFVMLKKLIWLRDIVDYYYDEITTAYENILSSIFKRERIKYSSKNFLEICQFSMAEIQEIKRNKFYSHSYFSASEERKNSYQKNYVFPLKGTIASKGNFRGIVKIIRNMSDIKKITPHDILISEYTRPNLVVGMAVCKGIITEEGGLTSHAAIVSRELGKPCLIGVEGCTDALKDGDAIKVINGKIYKIK